MHVHHTSHRQNKHHTLHNDNTLHVIAVVSNPARYKARYGLFEHFQAHVAEQEEARLWVVELAFGDRKHEIADHENPDHLLLRTDHELWHKENMINLGVRKLPTDWKYMAWVDADVTFLNPNWAQETMHQLQTHRVVQMFETAADLGPRKNIIQTLKGFGAQYVQGAQRVFNAGGYYGGDKANFWHPGYAWACRREFYENTGGLLDFAVLGSGDHHMALGIIGEVRQSLPEGMHPNYYKRVLDWERRALRAGNKDLGFVEGSLLHGWHGPKKSRKYVGRWDVLKEHQYDPDVDVHYDHQGVLGLSSQHKTGLRDDIRQYFRQRAEDSLDEG